MQSSAQPSSSAPRSASGRTARSTKAAARPALKNYDREGLEATFQKRGIPAFRSRQVYRWLFSKAAGGFEEMTDLARPFREDLAGEWDLHLLSEKKTDLSIDGTQKWLFGLQDGNLIETVLIPEARRNTICVSTQVGCPMKCSFCLTGTEGFVRNLTAGEILDQVCQVRIARRDLNITNVVLMGMGEPLLNYQSVVQAIKVMDDPSGFNLSSRRITLSTVGILPKLKRLLQDVNVSIAVSLHAATNELRSRLVPVNEKYPIEDLMRLCRDLPLPVRRRVTFEYTVIEGVNDSLEEADRLAELLRGFPSKVNIIPLNENPSLPYKRPSPTRFAEFHARLRKRGVHVVRRATRGDDISAACGQLKGRR
jgi:23S rRNA (adenine2503-C2)-methyltransferase